MGEDVVDNTLLGRGYTGDVFWAFGDKACSFLLGGNDPIAEHIDLTDAERNCLFDDLIPGA